MTGLERCEAAFERIKENEPFNLKLKDLERKRVTPSVVSQEAGFDKGYLKRKRPAHQPLISRIDAFANSSENLPRKEELRREREKAEQAEQDKKCMKFLLDDALARELLLVRRLRELEDELDDLKSKSNVLPM